jgi:prepilin-type processing-associated H-X9-DG protein
MARSRGAFSLVELIVVIGIIVVLMGILLPVLNGARRMARSTACQANLQQWGQSFQMYLNGNKGRPPGEYGLRWWNVLAPFNSDARRSMVCPEASEPRPGGPDPTYRHYKRGAAGQAWYLWYDPAGKPQPILSGDVVGSYGTHLYVLDPLPHSSSAPSFIRYPAKQADQVPLLGDCREPYAWVNSGEPAPADLQRPGGDQPSNGLTVFCMDRHAMAINMAFLDGHAERVPLPQLWKLKWSETFVPRDVVVPGPPRP